MRQSKYTKFVGPLIAERELLCDKGRRRVTVRLYAPVFVETENWVCRLEIRGLEETVVAPAVGTDAFQALELGLDGIRYYLERAGVDCTWVEFDGEGKPVKFGDEGNHGLRRLVPYHDRAFAERMNLIIDREVDRRYAILFSRRKK